MKNCDMHSSIALLLVDATVQRPVRGGVVQVCTSTLEPLPLGLLTLNSSTCLAYNCLLVRLVSYRAALTLDRRSAIMAPSYAMQEYCHSHLRVYDNDASVTTGITSTPDVQSPSFTQPNHLSFRKVYNELKKNETFVHIKSWFI